VLQCVEVRRDVGKGVVLARRHAYKVCRVSSSQFRTGTCRTHTNSSCTPSLHAWLVQERHPQVVGMWQTEVRQAYGACPKKLHTNTYNILVRGTAALVRQ
jgi:hypothetical protein